MNVPPRIARHPRPSAARVRGLLRGAVGSVAVAVLAAGCAAGQQAQTASVQPVVDGTNYVVGDIAIRAFALEPPTGTSYAAGDSAILTGVLVNRGTTPDRLVSITSRGFRGWRSTMIGQVTGSPVAPSSSAAPTNSPPVPIPALSRVSWGVPDATRQLMVTGLTNQLYPANSIRITFTFANAGSATISVPVQVPANLDTSLAPVSSTGGAG